MNRFGDIDVSNKRLPPVYGYHIEELVSIEQALEPIESEIKELAYFVKIAKKHCHYPSEHGLSRDQSASIYIYTMEWGSTSLYRVLNQALRSEDRQALKIWFPYLKLFDSALDKLPTVKKVAWRGVPLDVGKDFIENQIVTWWSISSCSLAVKVIENFVRKVQNPTLFLIEAKNGKKISGYTVYENEKEIILRMGTNFRVISDPLAQANGSHVVHLIEIDDDDDDDDVDDDKNDKALVSLTNETPSISIPLERDASEPLPTMTAAAPEKNDFDSNIDDRSVERFYLVWLDASVNEDRDTEEKLCSIGIHLKAFQETKEFQQFIDQTSPKDRLILIVSGRLGQEILPSIHDIRQVLSIYVYCMDKKRNEEWALNYKKMKAVVNDLNELISRIKINYQMKKKVEEPLSINIYTINTNASKLAAGSNGQFIFSQVLIDCLLQLKFTKKDKNQLIDRCKKEYEGNVDELNNICQFAQEYSSDKVLTWYTKETFFYKILNRALQNSDVDMIFLFRGYISDIHRQLQKEQTKTRLIVYHSKIMTTNELKTLKEALGQFISVNSFFSTTTDYDATYSFLNTFDPATDLERVLFEIDADPKMVTTKPFADISKYIDFCTEPTILFMIGSIFRLESINRNDDQVSIIRMTLCNDNENHLKQALMNVKQQTDDEETNLRTLGKVLWKMGKFDLAENYLNHFLNKLSSNDPSLSNLYEDLGELASQKGDYDRSIEWQQRAIASKEQNKSSLNRLSGKVVQLFTGRGSDNHATTLIQSLHDIGQSVTHGTIYPQSKPHGSIVAGGNARGDQANQLHHPFGLYIDNDRQSIYIADFGNDRIVEWKSNANIGQVIAGGNGRGKQTNQLERPTDLIVNTKTDSLIVCDHGNRRVVKWSRQNNTKDGQIIISDIDCFGLTTNSNGYLYVSDWKNHVVRRWKNGDINGTIVAGGNGKGDNLNQLNFPTYLFVDQDDSIYISDSMNHRIMKWMKNAKEGIIVAGGNGKGDQLTQLHYPNGVIVDHSGNIYVADTWNHRIMCWSKGSKEGRIILGENGEAQQSNQLNGPRSLSFDRKDKLYVVDCDNHRVQRFVLGKCE